jgi:signal transduction histidine kinase
MAGHSAKASRLRTAASSAAAGQQRRLSTDDPDIADLLKELEATVEPATRCAVLLKLARRTWMFDLPVALAYAEESVTIARNNGLVRDEANGKLDAARLLRLLGRYGDAEETLLEVRDVLMAIGDREAAGLAIRTLSALYLDLGLLEQALDFNREALAIFEESGNQEYYCLALLECADVFKGRQEFDEALTILGNVRRRLETISADRRDKVQWLSYMYTHALVLSDAKRSEQAIAMAHETIALAQQIACKSIEAICYAIVALGHARLKRSVEARRNIDAFLALADTIVDPYERITGLLNCGRAEFADDQAGKAQGHLRQALALAQEVGLKGPLADCNATLAEIYEAIGDRRAALGHFKAFYAIDRELHGSGIQHRIGKMQLQIRVDEARMETLEKAREELERLVTERTQQMRFAKEQAEIANRAKSDFLAHMSHELRTPLNAVIGFAELVMHEVHGPLGSAKYHDYLKDIHESGRLLLSLINDILNLSKIEAGRQDLNREVCDAEDICVACARLVRDRAHQAGIRFKLALQPDLRLLDVDVRAAKQVLLNLLTNAIKFTLEGGQVTLFATDDGVGPYVTLGVRDTGIGIAAEDLPRVLEPFGQVHNSYTRAQPGTGLGLPLAKLLTELHDGKFTIESKLGEGTVVTAQLPIADPAKYSPYELRRRFSVT